MFGFVYSLVAYVAFLGSFVYFGFFADGLWVPKTVDSGTPAPFWAALATNVGLMLLFGLQHSVMARQRFKDAITRVIPAHLERSTYVLVSAVALVVMMVGWQPMAGVVWRAESTPAVVALWTLNALGWLGVPVASFFIDHFDLFGLKQPFVRWRKSTYHRKGFVMPWLYRHVRHPMMLAILVGFWATPSMTLSHLVLSLGMSLYVYVGIYFEERSLARELGVSYAGYQTTTPKLVPRLTRTRDDEVRDASPLGVEASA